MIRKLYVRTVLQDTIARLIHDHEILQIWIIPALVDDLNFKSLLNDETPKNYCLSLTQLERNKNIEYSLDNFVLFSAEGNIRINYDAIYCLATDIKHLEQLNLSKHSNGSAYLNLLTDKHKAYLS